MLTEVYKGAPDAPELYVPQHHMLEAVEDARDKGVSKCYVDVATGVGKTYAVAHDIKKYLQGKPDARILYLCHKGQVLEQARDTISDVVGSEVSHGNFYKNQYEDQEQVTYATFQQMGGKSSEGKNYQAFDPKEFDYIVVDEGHHGPAPTYTEVIEYFDPDFQIGLTATDERMDGKDISEVLGPKVFEYTLEEAIAEGVLVKPDYRLFTEHEADLKDLLVDDDMPPTLKEINDRLTRVQRDRNYQQAIVGEIQAAQAEHEQPRTVIYCPDIQYADDFSKQIPEGEALHSGLSDEEQDARLKAFRRGEIPTLLVVDIFNEGIDVPEINTMVFLRGTESKMIFLQQLGRGLRTSEGKDKVIALDFAASWQRIMLIAELKEKVHTIYRDRNPRSSTNTKRPRQQREYFGGEDMVPFNFSFSKDALDAVNVVEKIRKEKAKTKKSKNSGSWLEKWNNAESLLKDMFGLDPYDPSDPDNPNNLPNQRITAAELQEYAHKIASGDKEAQKEFVSRRLRFVLIKAMNEYSKQPEANMLDIEDHFQNGLEALVVALDTYNFTKYNKQPNLGKYITMELWGGLQRPSRNSASIVRVPEHVKQKINNVSKYTDEYINSSEDGLEPTDVQLLEYMGWTDIDELQTLRVWEKFLQNGPENVEEMPDIRGDNTASIIEEVSENMTEKHITRLISRLSPDERHVLDARYGLSGGEYRTAESIARGSGRSASRVREIENGALRRLAQDPEARLLLGTGEPIEEFDHLNQNLPPSQYKIEAIKEKLATDNYWRAGDTSYERDDGEYYFRGRKDKNKKYLEDFIGIWGDQIGPKRSSIGSLTVDAVQSKLLDLSEELGAAPDSEELNIIDKQLTILQRWTAIIEGSEIWEMDGASQDHLDAIKKLISKRFQELNSQRLRKPRWF